MSNIPVKDANEAVHKLDVITRTDGADVLETQAVALVDPATGNAAKPDVDGVLPVKGPLTNDQLRASPLALPANASTEATLEAVRVLLAAIAAAAYSEDTAHVTGSPGLLMLALRADSDTPTADNGDYTILKLDEAGRLKVATQPASYPIVSDSITANGQIVWAKVDRASNVMLMMNTSALVGHNCAFEGSLDTTNGTDGVWFGVQAIRSNANTIENSTGVLAATPAYAWELSVNGLTGIRVRATAHTSGSATWKIQRGTYATEPVPGAQVSATQPVSFTQPALVAGTARIGFGADSGIWWDDSSTVLASSASFTGTSRDLIAVATATAFNSASTYAKEFRLSAESDQAGTLWLEVSRDNTNWRRVKSVATSSVAGGGQYAEIVHPPSWRYARGGFTNGATLQTRFSIGSVAIAG